MPIVLEKLVQTSSMDWNILRLMETILNGQIGSHAQGLVTLVPPREPVAAATLLQHLVV